MLTHACGISERGAIGGLVGYVKRR